VLDDLEVPLGIEMAARIFRAFYPELDLRRVDGTGQILVPQGTSWFTGPSLGHVARQIFDHEQRLSRRAE
jgi:hypothetical protein